MLQRFVKKNEGSELKIASKNLQNKVDCSRLPAERVSWRGVSCAAGLVLCSQAIVVSDYE